MTDILNPFFHDMHTFNDEKSFLVLEKYMFIMNNKSLIRDDSFLSDDSLTHETFFATQELPGQTIVEDPYELYNVYKSDIEPFSVERPPFRPITKPDIEKKPTVPVLRPKAEIPQGIKLIIETSDWSQPAVTTKYFKPKQRDTLFWCMFIAFYGYDEYILIRNHHGNRELEEKQKILDCFKKTPSKIKDANIKVTKVQFQEMISELMIDKQVKLSYIILFCLFYNVNIIIVYKKTYIEYGANDIIDDADCFILNRNADKDYEIDLETTQEKIKYIRENLFKKDNEVKTLRGASAYTINELKEILKKIDETAEKNMPGKPTKMDIYNAILVKCMW
jgi:hypothetical protein